MYLRTSGFTLVELIVVVTILAILSTIAFIYVQPYIWHSRNTVRLDSVWKLVVSVDTHVALEKTIMPLSWTWREVQDSYIAGIDASQWIYRAGIPNYRALGIQEKGFRDPSTQDNYLIGVTSKVWQKYSVGFVLEDDQLYHSKIEGTWSPRVTRMLIGDGPVGQNIFEITNLNDINSLYIGDTVTGVGIPAGTEVLSISNDKMHLKLSNNFTAPNNGIQLVIDEVLWLISSYEDWAIPVTDFGNVHPYLLN